MADPVPSPDVPLQEIASRIFELRNLSPEHYRRQAVVLKSSALVPGKSSDSQSFQAPRTHNFIITGVLGHLALIAPLTEPLAVNSVTAGKGLGNLTVLDRMLLKAMNIQLQLTDVDRSQKLFDNGVLSLASILPVVGGQPIDWSREPHIVPAGEKLQLDVNAVNATTGTDDTTLMGGVTEYGVVLVGMYVRVQNS